jgi:hypothetical protein
MFEMTMSVPTKWSLHFSRRSSFRATLKLGGDVHRRTICKQNIQIAKVVVVLRGEWVYLAICVLGAIAIKMQQRSCVERAGSALLQPSSTKLPPWVELQCSLCPEVAMFAE